MVALLGPNGSGKSTLVRGMLGLAQVLGGEVELFGQPVARLRDRWRVGYVPQRHANATGLPTTVGGGGRLRPRSPACGRGSASGAPTGRTSPPQSRPSGWPAVSRPSDARALGWPAAARADRPRPRGRGGPAGPRRADRRGRRGEPAGAGRHGRAPGRRWGDDPVHHPRAGAGGAPVLARGRAARRADRLRRPGRPVRPSTATITTTTTSARRPRGSGRTETDGDPPVRLHGAGARRGRARRRDRADGRRAPRAASARPHR